MFRSGGAVASKRIQTGSNSREGQNCGDIEYLVASLIWGDLPLAVPFFPWGEGQEGALLGTSEIRRDSRRKIIHDTQSLVTLLFDVDMQNYFGSDRYPTVVVLAFLLLGILVTIFQALRRKKRRGSSVGAELERNETKRIPDDQAQEGKLRWKTEFFEALIESSIDGVLVVNREGKKLLQNQRAIELLKIPKEIAHPIDDEKQLQFVVNSAKYPERFREKVHYLYAHPNERSRDEVEFKDGTVLDRYSAPVVGKNGESYGRIWVFRDVTLDKRAETQLAASLSVLEATLESTVDGILVVDQKGKITNTNSRFAQMWQIPKEIMASGDDRQALGCVMEQLKNPESFMKTVRELYDKLESESFDVLEFKDGRVFERYSQPQWINGATAGRVWCFRDITERKRAEMELEKVHRELLETSRLAGMADVASGVLHNIGNVLNSANVSATVVAERIRELKVVNIAKVSALMRGHETNLLEFLSQDPRGQRLPGYLQDLSDHLVAEQGGLLKELDSLCKNIEHIKEIVATQQTFAKVSGVTEILPVVEVVEDALRMQSNSLARHNIVLVREFTAQPTITVEKHKVLQILVNLLKNATEACGYSGRADKSIVLGITEAEGRVRISVRDNGVGISQENLTRIFSHGFTTRREGHGFGLHSGALAAKELKGSLLAFSDGVNLGATFVLELPLQPNSYVPAALKSTPDDPAPSGSSRPPQVKAKENDGVMVDQPGKAVTPEDWGER